MSNDDALHDLTQSEEGRRRLAAAHRYMQVGMCVNSVTHDINNHLGAIMAYAELLGMDHTAPEEMHMIEEIVEAVKRSSHLVEELTAIARKDRSEMTRCSTMDIARRVLGLRMYDLTLGRISVERELPAEGRLMTCNRPHVEQGLLYLLSNSLEAVLGTEKPVIRFSLTHEAEHVSFEVWDSGPGIPESQRESCFEPLMTTKGAPHLGLGLFSARRVAASHEGTLTYDPERGMRMRLPLRNGDLADRD